ncbi:hypothetical protein C0584_03615 [Candidatus Parcubacteria bacterium]|nr:MAG: hypothetical protein C0584_03615 [Candidatus Parcubacteria bacterium]
MKKIIYSFVVISMVSLSLPIPFQTSPVLANGQMCYEIGDAPDGDEFASIVVDFSQGDQYDGDPVDPARSVPEQGLALENGEDVTNFFSLGFGGEIIVQFNYPIYNGTGTDLKITEDTWGTYPLEKAEVFVSQDGLVWTSLGFADNTNLVGIHTTSEFDLPVMMEWANYVKIVDVSILSDFSTKPNADGYDLNAVEALYSAVPIPCDFDYACGDGFLYLNSNASSVSSDLYIVSSIDGSAEYKKTYYGNFQNTLAADVDGNIYSIDRDTLKIMQLMPDGTSLEISQTTLPASEGTLTVAPDNTMYLALNDERLYSIDINSGTSTLLVDLTAEGVDVQGGDIAVNYNNLMTIINTSGEVWTVELGNGYAVDFLGNIGSSRITGMTVIGDVYYVTNDTNDKIYTFTHADPVATQLGDFGYNFGSGDAASCAPERLEAGIEIDKSAEGFGGDPFEVFSSEEVTYVYAVTNTGELPLFDVEVSDNKCSPVIYDSGDDGNNKLDISETWNYSCVVEMNEEGSIENIATSTANDPFGVEVSDSDSFVTVVKGPGCTLTQGYWKTHGDPENEKKYDSTWDEYFDNWYEVIWTAPKGGNAYYILAHQYIAALLNSETAFVPEEVQEALDEAGLLLQTYSEEEIGALKGKNGKELRSEFIYLAGLLGGYNEGMTEVPHCSE